MKQTALKTFALLILVGCNVLSPEDTKPTDKQEKPLTETISNTQRDTLFTYWELDIDTERSVKDIQIGNDDFSVEIHSYSLNDSSVSWVNESLSPIQKDVYHNRQSDIYLIGKNDTILYKPIVKEIFRDSLGYEFFTRSVVWRVEYTAVRSNSLYFSVELLVPDTDWAMQSEMAIFFRTAKKGKVRFGSFENIGL